MSAPVIAIQYPMYQLAMRVVTAITNDFPALVTTSFAHNYTDGAYVRLDVPFNYGMTQISGLFGSIVVTGATTFSIDIDTRLMDVFLVPSPIIQYAQAVPIGDIPSTLRGASFNVAANGVLVTQF